MHFGSLVWTPNPSETILDTAFIGHEVQRGLYTILGKASYTLTQLAEQAFLHFMYCDSYAT